MSTKLDYFKYHRVTSVLGLFTAFIVEYTYELYGGTEHFVLKFPNGYGASIIPCGTSRQFWEVGILDKNERLCYTTPISNDVIGWLIPEHLQKVLKKIYCLPNAK